MQGQQSFYDDSSTAVGLNHRRTSHSPELAKERERRVLDREEYLKSIGMQNVEDSQRVIARNVGAHDDVGRRMQKYLKLCSFVGPIDGMPCLHPEGSVLHNCIHDPHQPAEACHPFKACTTLEALDLAEQESQTDEDDARDDLLGDSIESLMQAPVEPGHGGSKSRKRSSGRSQDPLSAEIERHFRRFAS